MVRINCVSSVVAGHEVGIEEMCEFLGAHSAPAYPRLRRALISSGSATRYSVLPLEDLARLGDAGQRGELYRQHATALAERAVSSVLDAGELLPSEVSTVIFVSSTGWSAPSIDTHLVRHFGLNPRCRRIPMTQLGCGGGVAALSLAAEIVRRDPAEHTLVVSAEVPSLQLQLAEPSYPELLAAAQFGDGAAAAVVSCEEQGCEIVGTRSVLLPETEEGGRIRCSATGLRVVPSGGLPRLIRSRVRQLVDECATAYDVDGRSLAFVVAHPRGGAVLEAVTEGLSLERSALLGSWRAWERCGNMVSASIYRALAELARGGGVADHEIGTLIAFGTGVACEIALVRWKSTLTVSLASCP